MNKQKTIIGILFLGLILNACTSVTILDSWTSTDPGQLKNSNVLVVARTDNNPVRIAFEEEITKALLKNEINAQESFKSIPKLNPDEKLTPEKTEKIRTLLKSKGYNRVVLSVVKDYTENTKTTREGGYYMGRRNYIRYPVYYHGFYDYYFNPYSYSTYGSFIPETYTTETTKVYILETVIYNLDKIKKDQLVTVITSKIIDPGMLQTTAHQYAKAIVKEIENTN